MPFKVSHCCGSNLDLQLFRPAKEPIAVLHQPAFIGYVFDGIASTGSAFHLIKRDLSATHERCVSIHRGCISQHTTPWSKPAHPGTVNLRSYAFPEYEMARTRCMGEDLCL